MDIIEMKLVDTLSLVERSMGSFVQKLLGLELDLLGQGPEEEDTNSFLRVIYY